MQYIKCPKCGREYLPDEIYVKGELLGKSKNVIRDPLGKILLNDGEEPEFIEHYNCDQCGNDFTIKATVSYETFEKDDSLNFKNQYVSLLD